MSAQPVSSAEVGRHYDRMSELYRILVGESIHAGYYLNDRDDSPLEVAQDRLTDLMIERTALAPNQLLLDVGCGIGQPALRLADRAACRVLGVTVSETQVRTAAELASARGLDERVTFQIADAMQLPFETAEFDATWALESLLHVPDRQRALAEIFRVLKPGGRLVVADVTAEQPLSEQELDFLVRAFCLGQVVGPAVYRTMAGAVGFRVIEVLDIGPNTAPTMRAIARTLMDRWDQLETPLDRDSVTEFSRMLTGLARLRRKLGYVLLVAEKPP